MVLERASELFEDGRKKSKRDVFSEDELYEQIGRLKMELVWICRRRDRCRRNDMQRDQMCMGIEQRYRRGLLYNDMSTG